MELLEDETLKQRIGRALESGGHQYTNKISDIFALQDEIALSVVASPLDKSMREMTSGCASARPTAFPEVNSVLATLVA